LVFDFCYSGFAGLDSSRGKEMMNTPEEWLGNLKKAIRLRNGGRGRRLRAIPVRTLYVALLRLLVSRGGTGRKVRAKTFFGVPMHVFVPEDVSVDIYKFGYYEEGLTRIFFECIDDGATILDVGAHFGYFSLLASVLCGSNGGVHSFEPTPSTYKMLSSNAAGYAGIVLNNNAVWSSKCSVKLTDYGPTFCAYNTLFSSRLGLPTRYAREARRVEVDAITLDDYVREKGITPALVKIDAESAELEILKGMKYILKSYRPAVTVEVGDYDTGSGTRSVEIVEYMEQYGYWPLEYKAGKISEHYKQDFYTYDNILFLPKKS
jgi:FkbM family methyltransferase